MSGYQVSRSTRKQRQLSRARAEFSSDRLREFGQAEAKSAEALQRLADSLSDEGLVEQLQHEIQKFDALSAAYAKLRREHIAALVKLNRAHTIVSSAAVRHRDEKLAACTRDHLHGMNKEQAEKQVPSIAEVLKVAEL